MHDQPGRGGIRPLLIVSASGVAGAAVMEGLRKVPGLATLDGKPNEILHTIPKLSPSYRLYDSDRLLHLDADPETASTLRKKIADAVYQTRGGDVAAHVRWLDATAENALRISFLQTIFPGSRFVYLADSPWRAISEMQQAWESLECVTYPQLPGWGDRPWCLPLVPGWRELEESSPLEIAARQWLAITCCMRDDLLSLDPGRWWTLDYGEFVKAPGEALTGICRFADLPEPHGSVPAFALAHEARAREIQGELEARHPRIASDIEKADGSISPPKRTRKKSKKSRAGHSRSAPPYAPGTNSTKLTTAHTGNFPKVLDQQGVSLLVASRQTGLVVAFGKAGRFRKDTTLLNSPIGLAASGTGLVIGTARRVQVFERTPPDPVDNGRPVYMRQALYKTGDLDVKDIGLGKDALWLASARFSTLFTVGPDQGVAARWHPTFVTAQVPEDRCHLNGVCVVDDKPRFATALARTDTPSGWRDQPGDGVVMEIPSGDIVAGSLAMPCSPRWHNDRLWLLESGQGRLLSLDVRTGDTDEVVRLPGFPRALTLAGRLAIVAVSKRRPGNGRPAHPDDRVCGIWLVDIKAGKIVAYLKFETVINEISAVCALPGTGLPRISREETRLRSELNL